MDIPEDLGTLLHFVFSGTPLFSGKVEEIFYSQSKAQCILWIHETSRRLTQVWCWCHILLTPLIKADIVPFLRAYIWVSAASKTQELLNIPPSLWFGLLSSNNLSVSEPVTFAVSCDITDQVELSASIHNFTLCCTFYTSEVGSTKLYHWFKKRHTLQKSGEESSTWLRPLIPAAAHRGFPVLLLEASTEVQFLN